MWSLAAAADGDAAREVPAAEARRASCASFVNAREPWQRADATLAQPRRRCAVSRRDDGAAVFRVTGAVQLLQIAGGGADELLRTLRGSAT